jgi:hypothetical protein
MITAKFQRACLCFNLDLYTFVYLKDIHLNQEGKCLERVNIFEFYFIEGSKKLIKIKRRFIRLGIYFS